jgi:hypothetical protein
VEKSIFVSTRGGIVQAARIEKLERTASLILNINAYNEHYAITGDPKKDKVSILKYLNKLASEEFFNEAIDGPIKISNRGIDEITHYGMSNELYKKLIAHIPDFIEKSTFILNEKRKPGKKHYRSINHLVAGVEIGEESYTIRSVLGSDNGTWYYSFFVSKIKKGEVIEALRNPNAVRDNNSLSDTVKDTTLIGILQANSSKVTDQNGEPRPVFHHTAAQRCQSPNSGNLSFPALFATKIP